MNKNLLFEVLKVKNFLKLWGSQVFSQVTLNLINFVIILKIFEATGSTVAISLVWIFYVIPIIILGPFSGTIVDLIEKRKILFFTNLAEAVIVLFYLFVSAKIWPIYGIVLLYSLVFQLYIPAEAATLPKIVSKKLLPSANSFFLFTMYGAMLVGFSLAGPLVRILGRDTPFILASLLLLGAAMAAYFLPNFDGKKNNQINSPSEFWGQFKEGYSFIRGNPVILFPLILLVFAQVIVTPLILLVPSYATQILKMELLDVGLAIILPFGLGALTGIQLVVLFLRKIRKKRLINFALGWAAFWLFVLSAVVPHLEFGRLFLAMISVFFLGLSYVALIIPSQTLVQEKTPEEFRGRVFGALGFLVNLAAILPILLTATIADIFGTTWTMFIFAVFMAVIWIYSWKKLNFIGVKFSKN